MKCDEILDIRSDSFTYIQGFPSGVLMTKKKHFDEAEYNTKMATRFQYFTGITEDGYLRGTIEEVRGGTGLNPIEELSLKDLRIVKKGLSWLAEQKGESRTLYLEKALNRKNKPQENIQIFLKGL